MNDVELKELTKDVTDLKWSMQEVREKQILNDAKLDYLTNEITNIHKKQSFLQKHCILVTVFLTICLIALIVIFHINNIV